MLTRLRALAIAPLVTGLALALPATAPAGAVAAVHLRVVTSGFSEATAIVGRVNDNALYVAEQHTGKVRAVVNGVVQPTPTLDIGANLSLGSEQGLLGIVFSPGATRLFVDYTDRSGNTQVDEYTMRVGTRTANPASRRHLLSQTQPFANHNGGQLAFGPDNMLYIALGDGGSGGDPLGNAQNLSTQLGKILRIDTHPNGAHPYTVPANNPFVHSAGARPEIWHYGLRNPWRFSFDRANGEMWIGDVGQDAWEEIDWAAIGNGGRNYQWNRREGFQSYNGGTVPPGSTNPIAAYGHVFGTCAIIGGYRYRGAAVPAIASQYVFSDFCQGALYSFTPNAGHTGGTVRSLGVTVANPTSFGQDDNGELYVLNGSTLWKIVP